MVGETDLDARGALEASTRVAEKVISIGVV